MRRILLPLAVLAGCLVLCRAAAAQLALGQYEDEAPLGTWNVFGSPPARSLGLGGAQFALATDASVSLTNPAGLLTLPRLSAALSASYASASMFRYSLVNTGVVQSTGNLSVGVFGVESAGLAFHRGAWALALLAAAPESYSRPKIVVGGGGYQLTFDQTGTMRVFHAGIARRLPAGVSLGLGLNYVTGRLDRTTEEQTGELLRIVTITDDKRETFRGFFLNGGITWEATRRLTAAVVLRSPFLKKGTGASLLRYEAVPEGTDIRIEAEAANTYRQPCVFGAGVFYRLSDAWSMAADAAYFAWSRYEVTYFDEPLARPFRSVLKAGGGIEYLAPVRTSGPTARIPLRIGFQIDPQPVTSVQSSYAALTFGTGIELRKVAVDISASLGREKGSGRSLKAARILLSLRYVIQE